MLPKALKGAIKRRLTAAARAKFHGKPQARLRFTTCDESAEIVIDNISIHLPQPFATRSIRWLKSYPEDVLELQVFLKLAKCADGLMFDVGAYIGTFAVLFCKASGYDAFAFEPVPQSQATIKRTMQLNHLREERIRIIGKAVGSKVGVVDMEIDQETGFALIQHDQGSRARSKTTISAVTTTIDVVRSASQKRVGLLKIDVEGFEGEVLQGSYRTLSEDRPIVSIETHNASLAGRDVDLQGMLDGVVERNYSLMRLNGGRITASSAAHAFLPRSHLLAVPAEKCSHYRNLLAGSEL